MCIHIYIYIKHAAPARRTPAAFFVSCAEVWCDPLPLLISSTLNFDGNGFGSRGKGAEG